MGHCPGAAGPEGIMKNGALTAKRVLLCKTATPAGCCFAGSTATGITEVKLVAVPAVWVAAMGKKPGCYQADMLRMAQNVT